MLLRTSHCFAALRLSALALALVTGSPAANADVQPLPITGFWRYNQTDNLDATNWWAPEFDDSGWPSGAGLFYVETSPVVTPRTTPLLLGRTTYYFRTHLFISFPPTNIVVTFSSRIDDGAVFYLNGREFQRVRMPAAPQSIRYTNFATAAPPGGDANSSEVFRLSETGLTNLVQGDNLLAVEVHQNSAASDDVVFGTSVSIRFTNSPPVFITQPTNLVVIDGRRAVLESIVDGNPSPLKQWFKDGVPMGDATNASMTFSNTFPANAGTYWLVASNALGSVRSSNAVVSVLADTTAPSVVSAVAQRDLSSILVSFSENVSTSATVLTNWAMFRKSDSTQRLTVQNAVLQAGSNVLLVTSPRSPGVNYTLLVGGVTDVSSVSNTMAPNSSAPLAYETDLVPSDAQTLWKYNQEGRALAPNWFRSDYDDSAWPEGAPLFAAGPTTPPLPEATRTTLALSNSSSGIITYYFRTVFSLPGPLQPNSLRLRAVVDDGALFYLNDVEALGLGVPSTRPLDYTNFASRSVNTATYEPTLATKGFLLSQTNLSPGGNLLAAELHQTSSGAADMAFGARLEAVVTAFEPRPILVLPSTVREGSGTLTNQGQVWLSETSQDDVLIHLSTGNSLDLVVPASLLIPAGSTNATFNVQVADDGLVNGPRMVAVLAGPSDAFTTVARVTVLDDETNSLSLVLPLLLTEGQNTTLGQVQFVRPAVRDIAVALTSGDTSELTLPPFVIVPAGATSVVFSVTVVNDQLIDGPQWAGVTARVEGWPLASANVLVNDDESLALSLALPLSLVEGGGMLAATGRVTVGGVVVDDIVVSLRASSPSDLTVPASVVIPSGRSNVTFVLLANENDVPDGARSVVITAIAPGFTEDSAAIVVLDNDPHHFRFSDISSPQDTSVAFGLTIRAEDASGLLVTNFTGSVPLTAVALEGVLPVEPSLVGPLSGGQWSGAVRVTAPGRLVRLSSSLAPGESTPFHVEPQAIRILTQPVADIAWHGSSGALLASVPAHGGTYANKLIVIDPRAGIVTNSYSLGENPGQIELSPSGQFLYATISNRLALRRFDLVTRVAGVPFGVGSYFDQPNGVTDFAVLPGSSDSVAAVTYTTFGANYGGVWRFNSGAAMGLNTFSAVGPYWIEVSPSTPTLYGFQNNNAFPLMRGLAQSGSALIVSNAVITGGAITYRHGVLYDDTGRAVVADTFAVLGNYPDVLERLGDSAAVEVDPVLKLTIYLSGRLFFGSGLYKFKFYDRDSFLPVGQFTLPPLPGGVGRLLLCGSNGLAFNTGDQIWLVRPPTLRSSQAAANLVLTQTAAPLPAMLGSNLTFTLTVSNGGPGLATFVNLSNALPANVSVMALTPSSGTVTQTAGSLSWHLTQLGAGESAALQIQLRPGSGGSLTNMAFVSSYESDPDFSNNVSRLGLFVQLDPAAEGIFEVQTSAEDMLYDPGQDRLLLSVATASGGRIAILDPHSGIIQRSATLNRQPSKIVRSGDGQYLYVSLKRDALVRRLSLPALSLDRDIQLGSELIDGTPYPFFAGDLEVLPDNPRSIAVWRVRREGPMASEFGRGLAIFDDGVMRPRTIDVNGGGFTLEFDVDQDTLYAFEVGSGARNLSRCTINANGIFLSDSLPTLHYSLGNDMEYAAGRFFNNGGRMVQTQPFGVMGTYAGSESAVLVEPDAATGRVFYLGLSDGKWQLHAYEMQSFNPLGTLTIPNVTGNPSSLVRWGTNGLAFCTSSGQVFIIRSSLVSPAACADLSLTLEGLDSPVSVGSSALFILTVNNRGPAPARELRLTNSFSPAVEVVWSAATAGQITPGVDHVSWTIPALAAGAEELVAVVVRPVRDGFYTAAADLSTTTADIDSRNNSVKAVLRVGDAGEPEAVGSVALAVNDVIWSASRGRLLATVNTRQANWGGALVSVDPVTLKVEVGPQLGRSAGQLAVSDDGNRLYAALDFDITSLDVGSLSARQRFPIDSLGGPLRCGDLEVLRGAPDSVVVGRLDGFTADLAVFDNSVQRSNAAALPSRSFTLERGATASPLYVQDHFAGGFLRYNLGSDGAALLDADSALLPRFTPIDLKWADGVLFSSVGLVIDPGTRTHVGTVEGISSPSVLCYDAAAQRAFYLSSAGSSAWIRAVDRTTLMTVGTKLMNGLSGTPATLVRWGVDGLAFRTSNGQLFVLRTSLIPSAPAADLSLALETAAPRAYVGTNFVYALTVTNHGPNAATNTQLLLRFSPNAGSLTVSASPGSVSVSNQQVVASFGSLAVGGRATLNLSVIPTQPGDLTLVAKAISSSMDPTLANNAKAATNSVLLVVAPDSVARLDQSAMDLAYDPGSDRLYASGGSRVTVIKPALAQNEAHWQLPGEAGRLALTGDRKFLYVVLDAGYRLARVNPSNGQLDFAFSPDDGSFGSLTEIADVAPLPGRPESYVLCGGAATHVYDGTVRRQQIMVDSLGEAFLQFSGSSNIVYGSSGRRLRILTIDDNGISETGWRDFESLVLGDFKNDRGLLYSPAGVAINPALGLITGRVTGLGSGTVVEPDLANQRLFFLTRLGTVWQLRAYDPISFGFIGSLTLGDVLGQPTRLIRWGQDGLAFGTTSNQLFLLRSSLVPAAPLADLRLMQTVGPIPALVASNLTFTVVITNAGPNPVTNAILLDQLPTNALLVGVELSQGATNLQAGLLTCFLGVLSNGASAQLRLTFRPATAGEVINVATIVSSQMDPQPDDNVTRAAAPVRMGLESGQTGVVALQTGDIAYDPNAGLLYATLTDYDGPYGESIITIDPATGLLGAPVIVGRRLSRIVISDDGRKAYVLVDGGKVLRRVSLPAGAIDMEVVFDPSGAGGRFAEEIKAVPGQPGSVVAIVHSAEILGGGPTVFVYDDAVSRPAVVDRQRTIEFYSPDGLLGYEPQTVPSFTKRIQLTPAGVVEGAGLTFIDGFMKADAGLIYTTAGSVMDPLTLTQTASFGVSGWVAPDHTVNRVCFLVQSESGWTLRTFDQQSHAELGAIPIPKVQGTPSSLLRCGGDRLAFRTSGGQVVLIRNSLIPPESVLRIVDVRVLNDVFQFSFISAAGKTYLIEESRTMPGTVWTTAVSGLVGSGGPLSVTLSNTPPAANRFFRVRLGP